MVKVCVGFVRKLSHERTWEHKTVHSTTTVFVFQITLILINSNGQ